MGARRLARGPVRSNGVGAVVGVALVVLLGGCGGASKPDTSAQHPPVVSDGPARARDLSFRYERIGKFGEMDQVLVITSKSAVPITITARLGALDQDGKAMPEVRVSSIYGTELGNQVLMPGTNLDVMVFEGERSADVRSVSVLGVEAKRVADAKAAPEPIVARVVNAADHTVAARFAVSGVQVENANATDVDVRVVFIIWSRPGKGESQQAIQVLKLSGLTHVPARGKVTVTPSAADATTIEKFGTTNAESIQAFNSH